MSKPLAQTKMDERRGGMTLEEVGVVLGVTRERVRQIEKTALRKLRQKGQMRQMLALARSLEANRGQECGFQRAPYRRMGLGD
jgi:hypothetical protein